MLKTIIVSILSFIMGGAVSLYFAKARNGNFLENTSVHAINSPNMTNVDNSKKNVIIKSKQSKEKSALVSLLGKSADKLTQSEVGRLISALDHESLKEYNAKMSTLLADDMKDSEIVEAQRIQLTRRFREKYDLFFKLNPLPANIQESICNITAEHVLALNENAGVSAEFTGAFDSKERQVNSKDIDAEYAEKILQLVGEQTAENLKNFDRENSKSSEKKDSWESLSSISTFMSEHGASLSWNQAMEVTEMLTIAKSKPSDALVRDMIRSALTQEQMVLFEDYLRTERLLAKEEEAYKERRLKYREALLEIHREKLQNKAD
jgi:hypothetical protein